MKSLRLLMVMLGCLSGLQAAGQGYTIQQYGKNVVQHIEFDWSFYEGRMFDIYYYGGGMELARYTWNEAEAVQKQMENLLDYPLMVRMSYVVFNSYEDYRQSNHHITTLNDAASGPSMVSGKQAFVFFTGDHAAFQEQIRAGMARVMMNDMLYGGSLQERLQNNVLLNMPEWFYEGLILYLSHQWDAPDESRLRAGIVIGKYDKFKRLNTSDAHFVGHSLWRYIGNTYGTDAISNLVYITRSSRSIEAGLHFVLGKPFNELYAEWLKVQKATYAQTSADFAGAKEVPIKKVQKRGNITRLELSPRNQYAAVATDQEGKSRVYILDLKSGKKKRIFSQGYRREDPMRDVNYPVLAWNPRENKVLVFYEKRSKLYFYEYNAATGKKGDVHLIDRIDRVLHASYSPDGRLVALSAVRRGQTDIYTFDPRTYRLRPITDDIYDDMEPSFTLDNNGIMFSSNRPGAANTKVTTNNFYEFSPNYNIFLIPDLSSIGAIKQLSVSPANERLPQPFDSTYFSYMSSATGVYQRMAVRLDTVFRHHRIVVSYKDTVENPNDTFYYSRPDITGYSLPQEVLRSPNLYRIDSLEVFDDSLTVFRMQRHDLGIHSYSINHRLNTVHALVHDGKRHRLLEKRKEQSAQEGAFVNLTAGQVHTNALPETKRQRTVVLSLPGEERKSLSPQQHLDSRLDSMDLVPYFQTDFPPPLPPAAISPEGDTLLAEESIRQSLFTTLQRPTVQRYPRPQLYDLSFSPEQFTTQFDNSLMNNPYLPYDGHTGEINSPVLQAMFRLGINELFKDYRLTGGFRVMGNFRGAEFFVMYDNLRHKTDRRWMFYRRSERRGQGNMYYRVSSNEIRHELRFPFSEVSAVRTGVFGRVDNITALSTEAATLKMPAEPVFWTGCKAEYVYDNTKNFGLNLFYGNRSKFYSEVFYSLNQHNTFIFINGFDLRQYTKISRQIIWANRLAGAASTGTARVVYYLGGVDNYMFPRFDQANQVDPSQTFAYKTVATNMRGFIQNARNGNAYAVWNSELRVPLFQYFSHKPLNNNFLQNFQVVGFFDAGSAWNGLNPLSEANAYNHRTIEQGPISAVVYYPRDPFIYGYGLGLRSVLMGMFMRADFAWGVENNIVQPRVFYFSIGTDF